MTEFFKQSQWNQQRTPQPDQVSAVQVEEEDVFEKVGSLFTPDVDGLVGALSGEMDDDVVGAAMDDDDSVVSAATDDDDGDQIIGKAKAKKKPKKPTKNQKKLIKAGSSFETYGSTSIIMLVIVVCALILVVYEGFKCKPGGMFGKSGCFGLPRIAAWAVFLLAVGAYIFFSFASFSAMADQQKVVPKKFLYLFATNVSIVIFVLVYNSRSMLFNNDKRMLECGTDSLRRDMEANFMKTRLNDKGASVVFNSTPPTS